MICNNFDGRCDMCAHQSCHLSSGECQIKLSPFSIFLMHLGVHASLPVVHQKIMPIYSKGCSNWSQLKVVNSYELGWGFSTSFASIPLTAKKKHVDTVEVCASLKFKVY